ncbi:MAG: EamA family transporter [Desulfobulbaceae bacterium]|nr:EamA family transporter [Desulfobulbaceae bacterium]
MDSWFLPALLSLVIFGLWGFFPKLAVNYMSPQSSLIYQAIGGFVAVIIVLAPAGLKVEAHPMGMLYAALTGATGIFGTLFYFMALRHGSVSVVSTMAALYPIITILLAVVILREPITAKQVIGFVFAFIAIIFLAS